MNNENHYYEGQQLNALFFADQEESRLEVGQFGVISIMVVMEPGMHASIPHALVEFEDGTKSKFCLHYLEGVCIIDNSKEI